MEVKEEEGWLNAAACGSDTAGGGKPGADPSPSVRGRSWQYRDTKSEPRPRQSLEKANKGLTQAMLATKRCRIATCRHKVQHNKIVKR
eukprot:858654-Amphidinium_carterae.1